MSSKRSIRKKVPYERIYVISTCFLCQKCFSRQKQLLNKKCSCDLTERPRFKSRNNARNYYTGVYNPSTAKDSNIDEEEATMQTDFEEKNTKHSEKEFCEEAYGAESSEKEG
ncbi:unnamed protein product [Rhizophagus irregularis]|nr:unnamed protein product [Rhizophagus irregularis]CAB5387248.1 unnamed protein product [Rhizophagus irregularis]